MKLLRVFTREGGEFDVLVLVDEPASVSLAITSAVDPHHVERTEDLTPERWPDYLVVGVR